MNNDESTAALPTKKFLFVSYDGLISDVAWHVVKEGHEVKYYDEWLVAGDSGVAFVVVGTGQTMKQAQHQAYSRISNILIPNMYYRDDIGERWYEDSDKLHNWGYLREN